MNRKSKILVAYDVATDTAAGRNRLRKVAAICCGFGVRVQKSVFECTLTEGQEVRLVARLRNAINEREDSLRLYWLPADKRRALAFGLDVRLDPEGLLLI